MFGKSGKFYANPATARFRGDSSTEEDKQIKPGKEGMDHKPHLHQGGAKSHKVTIEHMPEEGSYRTTEHRDGEESQPEDHASLEDVHNRLKEIFGGSDAPNIHEKPGGEAPGDEKTPLVIPGLGAE